MEFSTTTAAVLINILYLLVSVQGYLRIFTDNQAAEHYLQEHSVRSIDLTFGRPTPAAPYNVARYREICVKHFTYKERTSKTVSPIEAKDAEIGCYYTHHAIAEEQNQICIGDLILYVPDMIYCSCFTKYGETKYEEQIYLARHVQGFFELILTERTSRNIRNIMTTVHYRKFRVTAYWKVDPFVPMINNFKNHFSEFDEDKADYQKLDPLLEIANLDVSTLNPNEFLYDKYQAMECKSPPPATDDDD